MPNDTMQAVRFHQYGGPEVLVIDQIAIPHPRPGQVLVRLIAAGVNPADVGFRSGYFKEFFPLELPWIPGVDGAGIVEEVGEGVTAFSKG
ncbi:MAG TPA: alcohol dehydrogenase catalytic domain-containing protein, partial [Desulfomonilaceae bacterium]|nr:alcohol dehydrogenase catalytic domain-containing protein [Desulfomonilaceae bacterium]